MDRIMVYPASQPLDTDILGPQRNAMISDGFLAQAMLGNGPVVNGLACMQTAPATMQVTVGPGMIASLQVVDGLDFGSMPADNTDPLVKVGINLASTTFTMTAPTAAGASINYLIEACFLESDTNPVVLQYWNAANPNVNFSGPNNSGLPQNTQRIQRVGLNLVAGTPATTGTQTTPPVDAGYVPLYVITVAYGATMITNANIAVAPGAPFIGGGSLLPGRYLGFQKWAASGTYTYTPTVGTNRTVWQYVVGAGGSGGSAAATPSGAMSAGSGGASGALVRHEATSGFAGATIVIGAGGAASGAGNHNGNPGGTTSVTAPGFTLTAPGGPGGWGITPQTAGFITGAGICGPAGTGGNIVNAPGNQGGVAMGFIGGGTFQLVSGQGGPSPFGQGASQVGSTTNGLPGIAPGSGGSGGASGGTGAGGGATAGGAGADGYVIVLEYT
jgi:hypothetical protein